MREYVWYLGGFSGVNKTNLFKFEDAINENSC